MVNDFLQNTQFQLAFSKLPNVLLRLQTVSIPSIGLSHSEVGTPFSFLKEPDTKLNYAELPITFKLDENFDGYLEIFNWMVGMGFPENFDQYSSLEGGSHRNIFSDAILTILTNSNIPNLRVTFKDAFPTFLSQVDFTTAADDAVMIDIASSFQYHIFKIESIS